MKKVPVKEICDKAFDEIIYQNGGELGPDDEFEEFSPGDQVSCVEAFKERMKVDLQKFMEMTTPGNPDYKKMTHVDLQYNLIDMIANITILRNSVNNYLGSVKK